MSPSEPHRSPPPYATALLIAVLVVLAQALLVPLFAAPAANLGPRDLPVLVAGPPPAAERFARQLASVEPGAFDITQLPDAAAADEALRNRQAYAAFVLDAEGVRLHTASAASPTVATLLTTAAQQVGQGRPVPVTDVVPTDPDDPRGAGFAAGFLPLALTGLLAGIALTLAVRRRGPRLAGLVGYSVLAGLAGAAVLQYWLGIVPGTYVVNAAVIALVALAVSGSVAGLGAVAGRAGLGLGVLVVFLIGNPLSGIAAAPELLPRPWGDIGQWLPIGAGGTLLRSAAYFGGAGGVRAAWVLGGWALAGLVLVALGRSVRAPAPAERASREPAAAPT
jgi:hypothetical protein